jgi:heme/copper-type cytochrome/quinol oxidase subunit 2
MTWQLWIFVAFILIVTFGLGCIYARATLKKRGEDKMFTNAKANGVLAVFFTMIALVVAIDTIQLQVRFNKFTHDQYDCSTKSIRANNAITLQREKVDQEAAEFDIAMQAWLTTIRNGPVPEDNPIYLRVQKELADVSQARIEMVHIYADNPLPSC